MAERIDPTWVAYAFERPLARELVEAGLARVRDHYQPLSAEQPLETSTWLGEHTGVATFADPVADCAWPRWSERDGVVLASAYVPMGWERIVGELAPGDEAAAALAAALRAAPERAATELNSPAVIAIAETGSGRLLIVNDRLGAGRLYELRVDGGRLWSNRVGALPLLAGLRPLPNPRGWALFAAGGWFMRDSTPIEGVAKVAPGTVIEAGADGVRERSADALGPLVAPTGAGLQELVEPFAIQAVAAVRAAAALYPEPPRVDLSGGRDSRLATAATIAAGVPAQLRTSDITPGEADVARELVAALPTEVDHEVSWGEEEGLKRPREHLRERALAALLLHDGMRQSGKVRGRLRLPPPHSRRATLSGHGGEIGHGFYYKNGRQLRKIESGGVPGIVDRLVASCRRRHSAGRPEIYDLARSEFERALAEGEEHGIKGATLLDWFYLIDRFAHRSGLAAHAQRITIFSTPAFIRAAFALSPRERLQARLHTEAVARLVPEWRDVPFFKGRRGRLPASRRVRIWEGADGEAVGEMVSAGGPWTEIFDQRTVEEIWRRTRDGRADVHYEAVFERIAYRVAFEDYLELVGRRATAGEALASPKRS